MIVAYICSHCKKFIKVEDVEHNCLDTSKDRESPFMTSKDRLWNFTSTHIDKHPIEIHSKRQFKRECRKRGLVQVTRDDVLKKGQPMQPEGNPHKKEMEKVMEDTYREAVQRFRR